MGWLAHLGKISAQSVGAPTAKQITGRAGEDAALAHLLQHGLTLVERNYRCKGGEIDLVMLERMQGRDALVFVEVRKRADLRHGGAAASVTPRKQARLILAAQLFLQRYRTAPACRFDVIAIDGDALNWIRNAIEA
jgi:putative endonuclease